MDIQEVMVHYPIKYSKIIKCIIQKYGSKIVGPDYVFLPGQIPPYLLSRILIKRDPDLHERQGFIITCENNQEYELIFNTLKGCKTGWCAYPDAKLFAVRSVKIMKLLTTMVLHDTEKALETFEDVQVACM